MRAGEDMDAKLPYLSAYMGHVSITSTYYYIHLVPGVFSEMSGADYSALEKLIPEVAV
jgi:integrase